MTENKEGLPALAVAGTGYWGKNLVRNFAELGALRAVCDEDTERAGKFAAEHDVEALSWSALLARKDIAAVALATPAERHFPMCQAALEAGKHVFVEKPLSLQASHAEALCALARKRNRTLMVGHLLQYHPAFVKLRELVGAGELGRLQYIYSTRLNLGMIRREENILWSFAPHDISMILSLVGEEPETVSATGSCHLHEKIADVTTTFMTFPNGTRAHVFVSWLHPYKEQRLVVIGDRGMAEFNDWHKWDQKLHLYRHRIDWRDGVPTPDKAEAEAIPVDANEPLRLECSHFLDCISSGQQPRTDGEEGLRVLRVLSRAQKDLEAQTSTPARGSARYPGVQIHESAYVDEPCEIGEGTKIWHFSHLLPGTRLGRNCVVGQNVVIGPEVSVGDTCKIQNNVSLYKGVTLEDEVFCGPSCVFTNVVNPRSEIVRKDEFQPTLVKRGASIGANATIICGNTLGEYCFIAAGATVVSDVPPYALMAGIPARRIGWMSRAGARLGDDLVCPINGTRHRKTDEGLLEEIVS